MEVQIPVPAKQLKVVDETGKRIDAGKPVFYVGLGQPDNRTQELTGKKSIRVE